MATLGNAPVQGVDVLAGDCGRVQDDILQSDGERILAFLASRGILTRKQGRAFEVRSGLEDRALFGGQS